MDAYWTLFLLEKEKPDVDPARLSELVETWTGYLPKVRDIWADQKGLLGAFSLAQRPQTLDAAKSLLAAGREEMEEFIQERELQSESFLFRAHLRCSGSSRPLQSGVPLPRLLPGSGTRGIL